ncbi:MAG: cation:proton antiporter family protein, partial [Chloroflexota bacterium]
MDVIWIVVAFIAGFIAQLIRIPTIVGYLLAGLVLSVVGVPDNSELIIAIGDLGVTLLLFTIGLHLRIKSLLQPEVLFVGSTHLLISGLVFGGIGLLAGWNITASVLVGVALGFSSTVLTAKSLEARGEINAYHGRIAIGVLILQDVVAIALLAVSGGGQPSPLAFGLIALVLLRPVLIRLMVMCGNEELMLLFGLLLALSVGVIFEMVGLDAKLGALVAGLLLSGHTQSDIMYENLWALKEVFLVGFFLQVGLAGFPDVSQIPLLLGLFVLLPVKGLLFFWLFVRFNLTGRTAFMASVTLTAYSEFALIVVTSGAASGVIPTEVVSMVALLVTVSFIVNALLGRFAEDLWHRIDKSAQKLETDHEHPERIPRTIGATRYLVIGMGRAGTSAYDYLKGEGQRPMGIDADPQVMEDHLEQGRRVIYGDSQDSNFWGAFDISNVKAVLLMIPGKARKIEATKYIREAGYTGHIHALVRYDEDIHDLLEAGVDEATQPLSRAG